MCKQIKSPKLLRAALSSDQERDAPMRGGPGDYRQGMPAQSLRRPYFLPITARSDTLVET
ncbi:hypothetical protein HQ37_02810 [Porphyromonas sp. COT-239 OH1446]|nr:hypothetical protein HQ37_02810 [Porphyromonas sp. COT-239 OH1446]